MHDTPPRAGRREWIGLAVIALPCLVYAMDMTVLNLALPAIAAELRPSASELLWIIDAYSFLVAGFLVTMGALGDRYGRRRLLLIGAAAFAAASALAAYARSTEMLIAMRALLGIAGATLAPSTMSLIRNMFHHPHERQFAIGIWIASFSLGGAIGPLVGGVMLEWFHWGSVFLLALPVMALLLVLGPVLLPEYRDPQAGRVDLPSVGLSIASVLLTIHALKQGAEHGPGPAIVLQAATGLALGAAFLRRQRRLPYPLLDLGLFAVPRFRASITAYALTCLAMFGVYIFVTQHLQGVLGLSPLDAGLATVPWSLAFVAGSLLAPRLARRVAPGRLMVAGLWAAALSFVVVAAATGPQALPLLVAATVLMSLGMAPVMTVGNEMIITAAPAERAGSASALSETAAEFSGAAGVAVFGSLGLWIYRAGLPAGTAPEALATLGGALALADTLPDGAGASLRDGARLAFTGALQAAALAGAALVAAAALLARRMLRAPA